MSLEILHDSRVRSVAWRNLATLAERLDQAAPELQQKQVF